MFCLRVPRTPPIAALLVALADRPGLALVRGPSGTYVACDPDGDATALDPFDGARADATAPTLLARAPRFIGAIPYEALRGIERPAWTPPEDRAVPPFAAVRWLRYPAVVCLDPRAGSSLVVGTSRSAVRALAARVERVRVLDVPVPSVEARVEDADLVHALRIERAQELIRAGDLYQVNLARRIALRCRFTSSASVAALFLALDRATRARWSALLVDGERVVISTSPELCLAAEPDAAHERFDRLVTEPIKGTRPRGAGHELDRALAAELDASEKERAELAMIVDVERNDLHRVSRVGSVRVVGAPVVRTLPTVHHRFALLAGRARPDTTRAEVLEAMLPSGSVTGAPKIRAMEIIRALEARRRGLYTGALGYASHAGGMCLSMAIRTLVFEGGEGEYLVGGGIVVDSDPAREVEETRWKARQLERLGAPRDLRRGLEAPR